MRKLFVRHLAVFVFAVQSSVILAQQDDLTGEDLAALMHAQISSIDALWFRGIYQFDVRSAGRDADNKPLPRTNGECAIRLGSSEEMARTTSWWIDPDDEVVMREDLHYLWKDGLENLYNETQKAGMIRGRWLGSSHRVLMLQGLGCRAIFPAYNSGLHELVEAEGVGIVRLDDDEEGRPRIRLDIPPSHPEIVRRSGPGGHFEAYLDITLDPGLNYSPVRVEARDHILEFRWEVVESRGHVQHGGVWVPTVVENEDWLPIFLHPQSEHFPAFIQALVKRGIHPDPEAAGEKKADLRDPVQQRRFREALQEVFPEGLPEGHSEGRRRLVVTEVLGVNDGVPDLVFESPFPEGVEVYDARDMQTYIVRNGELVRTPRADHEKK